MGKRRRGIPKEYASLLVEVKERIRAAQLAALRKVNKELVALYWDIGKLIADRQSNAAHGAAIAERLAKDIRPTFPGVRGLSRRNIFYMREFYQTYCDLPKGQPLVAQIGWSQNLTILQKCEDPLEREFYIRTTQKCGWSKNVLVHQIENQSYQKTLIGQTNFSKALSPRIRNQAKLAVRDGDGDAATATLLCMIRHAMAVADHPTFLDTIIAMAQLPASLDALEAVAGGATLSRENRARLVDALASLEITEVYRNGLIADRAGLSDTWQEPAPHVVHHSIPLMYYQDIVQMIAFNRWWIETSARDPWDAYAALVARASSMTHVMKWRYPVTVGVVYSFTRSHVGWCETLAQRDVTIVALECQRYRSRHGAFPVRPADLVPNIVDDVPVDPFTGKDLVYRLTSNGFVVYSVGENLTDDGGVGRHAGADDIAWPRAPRPTRRSRSRSHSSSTTRP